MYQLEHTYLLPAHEEELIGIPAIRYGASHDGEPVKDDRGLILTVEEQLEDHVKGHRYQQEAKGVGKDANNLAI